jgi:small-conductance mechanosensitive channel
MTMTTSNAGNHHGLFLGLLLLLCLTSGIHAKLERGTHSPIPVDGATEGVLHNMRETVGKTFEDMFESVDDILEHSTLAGQISPVLKRFLISPAQVKVIWSGMTQVAQLSDLILLVVLGWGLVPLFRIPYEYLPVVLHKDDGNKIRRPFRKTKSFDVVETVSQVAKLALVVYVVDMLKIVLVGVGFSIPRGEHLTHAFSYILYTCWAATRVTKFKKYALCHWTGESEGRLGVLNRLLDAAVYSMAAIFILDVLKFEMGLALQGIFAFGSVGTLVFSLASKDIATQLMYGVLLASSNRIYEGDSILLNKSKMRGTVHKLGWVETIIRSSDETQMTVPNSELVSQQVSNLSRIHQCQVQQTLRFKYEDAERLPAMLQDIKKEIRANCPAVITDGSRPFRAVWTSFESSYLEVLVDAHFRIRPIGNAYYENRMKVLQAIDVAVKKHKLEMVMA